MPGVQKIVGKILVDRFTQNPTKVKVLINENFLAIVLKKKRKKERKKS